MSEGCFENRLEKEEQNTIIRKYLDFPKFLSLITTNSLYFARPHEFNDPLDSLCPKFHSVVNDEKMNEIKHSMNKEMLAIPYYQAISKLKKSQAGSVSKLPAGEIEKFVTDSIKKYLQNKKEIQKYIKNLDVADQNNILDRLTKLDYNNPKLIRGILDGTMVSREWIKITLCKNQIQKMLENFAYCDEIPAEIKAESPNPVIIRKDIRIATTSKIGCNVLIISSDNPQEPMHNTNLIKVIVKSHYWNELLLSGKVKNPSDIRRFEGRGDNDYIQSVINLRFLSPEITEAILNGTQPRDLTVKKLFNLKTLDWQEQKQILKIA